MTPAAEKDLYMFGAGRIRAPSFSTPLSSMSITVFSFQRNRHSVTKLLLFASPFCFSYLHCGYFVTEMYVNISLLHYVTNSVVGQPESATSMMTKSTIAHE
jgi:hypothetical protein